MQIQESKSKYMDVQISFQMDNKLNFWCYKFSVIDRTTFVNVAVFTWTASLGREIFSSVSPPSCFRFLCVSFSLLNSQMVCDTEKCVFFPERRRLGERTHTSVYGHSVFLVIQKIIIIEINRKLSTSCVKGEEARGALPNASFPS